MGSEGQDPDAVQGSRATTEQHRRLMRDLLDRHPWLTLTFDQLRTLLVMADTLNAGDTASRLPTGATGSPGTRQQASVLKQIKSINECFEDVCGEKVIVSNGRGQPWSLTPTGEDVVDWVEQTFQIWADGISTRSHQNQGVVEISTTAFAIDVLGEFWPRIAPHMEQHRFEVNTKSVGTRDFRRSLDDRSVDLVLGGVAVRKGQDPVDRKHYDFIELGRQKLWLLTTQADLIKKCSLLDRKWLEKGGIRFALPTGGLIIDILKEWLGTDYREKVRVVSEIPDIYYGLAYLDHGIGGEASMLVLGTIRERMERSALPTPRGSSFIEIDEELAGAIESVGGLFARREVLESRDEDHPLTYIWNEFQAFAKERQGT